RLPLLVAHDRRRPVFHGLRPHHPTQRPAFVAHRVPQQQYSFQKCVGPRRTPRHIHINGQKFVHALHDAVNVVHAARTRTCTHGDHPARFHHLLIKAFDDRRHFDKAGAGHYHEVGFARRTAHHFRTKPRNVVFTRDARRHLHKAAGKAEVEWPNGILATPRHHVFEFCEDNTPADRVSERPRLGVVGSRGSIGLANRPAHSHLPVFYRALNRCCPDRQSSAPTRQRYASVAINIPTNTTTSKYPNQPASRTETAQAKRNTASKSKMTKNMATR